MTEANAERLTRAKARLGTVVHEKYRLDEVLGIGGMATVYSATHRNQARFAIKLLHAELSLYGDVRARFLREGYAANSVKHPGAVRVVDDDVTDDGAAFLVMELLDGVACDELWRRSQKKLAPALAGAILVQLLDVLAAAHGNGIVHRDVKPSNLFLTKDGVVKVLDFGIARARDALPAEGHSTETGMMLGTPAFMAPEQALGKTRDVDGRTDVWAAAATYFTLVSGQLVHAADPGLSVLIAAATRPARSLASVADNLPRAMIEIVDRALAFPREDRWESAKAMREALITQRTAASASPEDVVAASVLASETRRADASAGAIAHTPSEAARTTLEGEAGSSNTVTGASASLAGTPPVEATPRRRAFAIGLAALAIAVGAGAFLMRTNAHVPVVAVATPAPSAPSEPSIVDAALPAIVDASVPIATSAAPTASAVPARARAAPAPKPKPAATAPAPDCDPNFTLDDQGRKHFKPECFLKP